ncbi:cyclic nucleotide-binding domain-containing protein [Actinomadura macra]|uniref:cyclic nucleotide-binding domain-containing protein n=1 Tax=Actinomadura macra TaxID=46164 RepID=UPI00082C9622|nr:cyclic nucleotide-binding domain-containing protein [Actinomadura macra]
MDRVSIDDLTRERFFHGMPERHLARLVSAGRAVEAPAGHRFFEENGTAESFWLIRSGRVALDLHVPGRGPVVVETLGASSILGWSWLFSPHRWRFGAIATRPVEAIRFDAPLVRTLGAADPALGYDLALRFGAVMLDRLEATRIRVLDLYARPEQVR